MGFQGGELGVVICDLRGLRSQESETKKWEMTAKLASIVNIGIFFLFFFLYIIYYYII